MLGNAADVYTNMTDVDEGSATYVESVLWHFTSHDVKACIDCRHDNRPAWPVEQLLTNRLVCACMRVCVCVRACVSAYVRARARARVCVCV